MSDADTFGRRLVTARTRRDFKAGELAKRAGIHPTLLSHYEHNERAPAIENIRKLARALNITADFLLGLSTDTRRIEP